MNIDELYMRAFPQPPFAVQCARDYVIARAAWNGPLTPRQHELADEWVRELITAVEWQFARASDALGQPTLCQEPWMLENVVTFGNTSDGLEVMPWNRYILTLNYLAVLLHALQDLLSPSTPSTSAPAAAARVLPFQRTPVVAQSPPPAAPRRGASISDLYDAYLRSADWARRRKAALLAAGHACQLCKSTAHLEVHHNTYERVGRELPSDLIVLCARCHAKHHDIVRSNRRYFVDGHQQVLPFTEVPQVKAA